MRGKRDLPRHQRHSATSRAAAIDALETAPTQRARVYRFIRERGDDGATDEEIQESLDMNPSTERPRRIELTDDLNVVRDSGRYRKTRADKKAVVWECRTQPGKNNGQGQLWE